MGTTDEKKKNAGFDCADVVFLFFFKKDGQENDSEVRLSFFFIGKPSKGTVLACERKEKGKNRLVEAGH